MATSLLPVPKARFFTASGVPLVGGRVYSYAAGTTTPKATYTSSAGNVANSNPVELDAAGEADIWLSGNYKIVLKNSADVEQWTVDNVSGLPTDLPQWLTVSGTDTIIATPQIAVTGYSAQQTFLFIAAGTNTGAVTINISGLGAKSITKKGATPLAAGDIISGMVMEIIYDGTEFQLLNPSGNSTGATTFTGTVTMSGAALNEAAAVTIAAATTTNIFAAASNHVKISAGTGTIDHFDPTAGTGIRWIEATGAFTVVYNASRIITPGNVNFVCAAGDTFAVYSDGTEPVRLLALQPAAGQVLTVKKQVFNSTGTYTPSAGMIYALIEGKGGGGGGGGVDTTAGTAGAGGGEGELSRSLVTAATIGASQAVTIGAGGTAGTSGGGTGGTGGVTSVGSIITAGGGLGGAGGAGGGNFSLGGAGGTGGTADTAQRGAPGHYGFGRTFVGGNAAGGTGGGTGGAVGPAGTGDAAGNAGTANTGGGGSGAIGFGSSSAGGPGGSGYVFIIEYCCR